MFRIYVNLLILFQRLQAKVIKLVDVSYGGENGFNQAIELAAESLQNVKFIQEKKLIGTIIFYWCLLIYLFFILFDSKIVFFKFKVAILMRFLKTLENIVLVLKTRWEPWN